MKCGHEHLRCKLSVVGPVVLAVAPLLVLFGCIKPPERISLDEFLELVEEENRVVEKQRQELDVTKMTSGQMVTDELDEVTIVDEQLGPYRVGPSDIIGVRVTLLDQLELGAAPAPVQVRIDRNGDIDLPLVGTLHVEGLEIEDIENEIERAYVPRVYKDAIVNVQLLEVKFTQIIVRGAVAAPGLTKLRRTERNLLYAMDTAGGISPSASGRVTVTRIRRPSEAVTFDLTDPVQLRAALGMDPLEEGDIIFAEGNLPNAIYIYGALSGSPTFPVGVKPRINDILAQLGGIPKDLNVKEATLVRRMADGRQVFVKLDLHRLLRGEDPNFQLSPGDHLWVNWTPELRLQDFINQNFFLRFGASGSVSYSASSSDQLNSLGGDDTEVQQRTGGTTLQDQFDPFGFFIPPMGTP